LHPSFCKAPSETHPQTSKQSAPPWPFMNQTILITIGEAAVNHIAFPYA
jgi:hypothetical protein